MHPISNLPLQYDFVDDSFCVHGATNLNNPPASSQSCFPPSTICDGGVDGQANGICNSNTGECICRLGYGGRDCSISPTLNSVQTNAIFYSQGVPINEYLDVSWASTGDLPYISVLLLKNGDPQWPFASYLAQQIINTNNFVWKVGSALPDLQMGDGYQIRVWFGDNLYADSDPFSIADPCAYKYCGDKGICTNGTCECVPGYSGIACAIGPCERAKCDRLHSSCNNDDYIYFNPNSPTLDTCPCTDGYSGSQCRTPPSCASKTCKNGADLTLVIVHSDGTSNDTGDCGVCDCLNRWRGDECETCTLQCENGGKADSTCSECICTAGYFGSTCDCRYYTITIPIHLADTSFLDDPIATARFQRTLANDLALAAGVATGVIVEVVVNETRIDSSSGDVIATVFFSLECILSSAAEGGSNFGGLLDFQSLVGPEISNGASNKGAAGLYGTARDAIENAANHFEQQGKYAQAQTSADATSDLLLPGQQGSLPLAFSMLSNAFSNADSLVYHGVVTGRIDKTSVIVASDPTNQDIVPNIQMASDPFTASNRRQLTSRGNLNTGSVAGVVVGVLIGAMIVAVGIAYFWWTRVKKQRVSQEMEMESRVLRELKSEKHQNAYEPQTPFTPATPATPAITTAMLPQGDQYRPPLMGRGRQSSGDVDERPLVQQTELKSNRSSFDKPLR